MAKKSCSQREREREREARLQLETEGNKVFTHAEDTTSN